MLCAGIGPGFVMVVIVVGIIRVDMVSIFATFRLRRGELSPVSELSREPSKDYRYAAPD